MWAGHTSPTHSGSFRQLTSPTLSYEEKQCSPESDSDFEDKFEDVSHTKSLSASPQGTQQRSFLPIHRLIRPLIPGRDLTLEHSKLTLRFKDPCEEELYQGDGRTPRQVSFAFLLLLGANCLLLVSFAFRLDGVDLAYLIFVPATLYPLVVILGVHLFRWPLVHWKALFGFGCSIQLISAGIAAIHMANDVVSVIGQFDLNNDQEALAKQILAGFVVNTIATFLMIDVGLSAACSVDVVYTMSAVLAGGVTILTAVLDNGTWPAESGIVTAVAVFLTTPIPTRAAELRSRRLFDARRGIEKQLEQRTKEASETRKLLHETQAKLDDAVHALRIEGFLPQEKEAVEEVMQKNAWLARLQIQFKDIHLEKTIGNGSFGEVLRADYLGTTVAVKRLLRNRITTEYLTSFFQELRLISTLRHPSIVQFIGASFDSYSNICIVTEFMERGDLKHVLSSKSAEAFSWADPKIKMAIDTVRGVAYLHGLDVPVLHRDLKSANVLVSATFGCKLSDFGLSRSLDYDETLTITGTPLWFPPEMIRGERYTEKCDIYSLGIVLTELDTQSLPYSEYDYSSTKLMHLVAFQGLRPKMAENCPCTLKKLIRRCVIDDPVLRPSAVEVLHTLRTAVQEELDKDM